jgi:hypothetical protein
MGPVLIVAENAAIIAECLHTILLGIVTRFNLERIVLTPSNPNVWT